MQLILFYLQILHLDCFYVTHRSVAYVRVHVHITRKYLHTYTHTHTHAHAHMCIYLDVRLSLRVRVRMCTHLNTCVCSHAFVHLCGSAWACVKHVCACTSRYCNLLTEILKTGTISRRSMSKIAFSWSPRSLSNST